MAVQKAVLGATALLALLGSAEADLGSRLERTFGLFHLESLTVESATSGILPSSKFAKMKGKMGECDSRWGTCYSHWHGVPSKHYPDILCFNGAGQLSGFGARAEGKPPQKLIDAGFWMPAEDQPGFYDLIVATRTSAYTCSSDSSPYPVGTEVTLAGFFPIPLTAHLARKEGWTEGACILGMGTHYSFDIETSRTFGEMSWNASNLLPIQPMYHPTTGQISAVLIDIPIKLSAEPLGDWEGPFKVESFCRNWCKDAGCTFRGAEHYSTMHWLFESARHNGCAGAKCTQLDPFGPTAVPYLSPAALEADPKANQKAGEAVILTED